MQKRISLLLVAGVWLVAGACYPGMTLKEISASPAAVTYEYTHVYSSEYPEAVKKAEQHCAAFGKHAKPVGQPVRLSVDRSTATFECVAGH